MGVTMKVDDNGHHHHGHQESAELKVDFGALGVMNVQVEEPHHHGHHHEDAQVSLNFGGKSNKFRSNLEYELDEFLKKVKNSKKIYCNDLLFFLHFWEFSKNFRNNFF